MHFGIVFPLKKSKSYKNKKPLLAKQSSGFFILLKNNQNHIRFLTYTFRFYNKRRSFVKII